MAEGSGGLGHIVTPADRLARIAHDPQHVCERQLASCGCFLPHLLVCTADRSPGAACAERTWPILPDTNVSLKVGRGTGAEGLPRSHAHLSRMSSDRAADDAQ